MRARAAPEVTASTALRPSGTSVPLRVEVGAVELELHLRRLGSVCEHVGACDQPILVEEHEALVEGLHAVEVARDHLLFELAETVGLRDPLREHVSSR